MNMEKAVIGIQCRLSSSRLPGKALLRLGNSSIIGFLVERALALGIPVYLLTSDQSEDDLLEREALSARATGVIRGPLENVLRRFEILAQQKPCKYIARVTADNPLTEFRFVRPLVDLLDSTGGDYACMDASLCPEGTNVEVIKADMLSTSAIQDQSSHNREHVTPWIKSQPNAISRFWNKDWEKSHYTDLCDYSFTIDRLRDYVKVSSLVNLSLESNKFRFVDEMFVQQTISLALNPSVSYPSGRNHNLN